MRGIKAGLLMLGKSRAVEIVDAITAQLRRVMQPGGMPLSGAYLDRLADAIVSLEYYIETLQAGRSDPWYMLDNAAGLPRGARARARAGVADGTGRQPRQLRAHGADRAAGRRRCIADAIAPGSTGRALTPPVLAPARAPEPEALGQRSGTARAVRRGGARGTREDRRHYPAWDQNPMAAEALGRRAALVPHPEGQRPHGRRARTQRVFLVHGKPGQPAARWHPDALARDPRHAARGGRAVAEARGRAHRRPGTAHAADTARRARARAGRRRRRPPVAEAEAPPMAAPVADAWAAAAPAPALASAAAAAPVAPVGATPSSPRPVPRLRHPLPEPVRARGGAGSEAVSGAACRAAADVGGHRGHRAAAAAGRRQRIPGTRRTCRTGGTGGTGDDTALRDIYARETSSHVLTVRTWLAREQPLSGAARADRRGVPRLPHAFRQLADGRGPARHAARRAAQSLAAQVLRQRRRAR